MRKLTRLLLSLGSLIALVAAGLVLAPSASAAPIALTCALGSQTTTYSPPITNTPQNTTASINESYGCASPLVGVSSGTGSTSILENASCLLTVQPAGTDTLTYHWNTGQSSTITFNLTNVVRAANGTTTVTSLGSVSSGLGQGSTATRIVVLPALSLTACATTGVSSETGTATLAII
ncbi:hypothetical protein ACWEO9_12180 [Streptomyces albidoflavus]